MGNTDLLPSVSSEAMRAFKASRQAIIDEVVERSMARKDEVAHHGAQARVTLVAGLTFTTDMLETAMGFGEPELLDNQLRWAIDRLPHDGVMPEHVLNRFKIYAQVVTEMLPQSHADEINAFLSWMIERQEQLMEENRNEHE